MNVNKKNFILDLYDYPELNTKIYLHFKNFKTIENLNPYKNLQCIWLENNKLTKIQGLEGLADLRHIYLQNNYITKLEGFDNNLKLVIFNAHFLNNIIFRAPYLFQ